jgi:hypothetical protein
MGQPLFLSPADARAGVGVVRRLVGCHSSRAPGVNRELRRILADITHRPLESPGASYLPLFRSDSFPPEHLFLLNAANESLGSFVLREVYGEFGDEVPLNSSSRDINKLTSKRRDSSSVSLDLSRWRAKHLLGNISPADRKLFEGPQLYEVQSKSGSKRFSIQDKTRKVT